MASIFLVRHSPKIIKEESIKTIEQISNLFRERLVSSLITSPLQRAIQTADRIGELISIKPEIDSRIVEISRGEYNDLPMSLFNEIWAKEDFSPDFIPQGGESINQGRKRALGLIMEIGAKDSTSVLITHKGIINNLLMVFLDYDYNQISLNHLDLVEIRLEKDIITFFYGDEILGKISKEEYNGRLSSHS